MNAKTTNYVVIIAGLILLIVGVGIQPGNYGILNYVAIVAGIMIIFLGIWGLKSLSWFAKHT
jgi:hypothetical protein